jgi:hypothetical protein
VRGGYGEWVAVLGGSRDYKRINGGNESLKRGNRILPEVSDSQIGYGTALAASSGWLQSKNPTSNH